MAALLLMTCSLLIMLARVAGPIGQPVEGREPRVVTLGLRERVLYHRTGLYAFGVILLLLAATRLLSPTLQLVAVLACYAVLMVPIRYRFTSAGVAVNRVVFRRWREFTGVEASRRSLTLTGGPGTRGLTLRLLAEHQDEALTLIRLHLPAPAPGAAPAQPTSKGGRRAPHRHARSAR